MKQTRNGHVVGMTPEGAQEHLPVPHDVPKVTGQSLQQDSLRSEPADAHPHVHFSAPRSEHKSASAPSQALVKQANNLPWDTIPCIFSSKTKSYGDLASAHHR
jgi:hypothetical protein